MEMQIQRIEFDDELGNFIDKEFNRYAKKFDISVGYSDFCFIAENNDAVMGVIVGHSYYKEVHITDLIVKEEYRGEGVGSELIRRVEEEFGNRGYENINLTTYAFQAPEFYKRLGFEVEFARKSTDDRLTKFFLIKHLQGKEQNG
jgi:Predicted acetyltransferase